MNLTNKTTLFYNVQYVDRAGISMNATYPLYNFHVKFQFLDENVKSLQGQ